MVASLFFPSTSSTPPQGSETRKYLIQRHRRGLPKVFVEEVDYARSMIFMRQKKVFS